MNIANMTQNGGHFISTLGKCLLQTEAYELLEVKETPLKTHWREAATRREHHEWHTWWRRWRHGCHATPVITAVTVSLLSVAP